MISFVVVNYNNSAFTLELYSSLVRISGSCFKLIVVDNNSTDGQKKILSSIDKDERVKLIFSDVNLGYFRALNVGIAYSRRYCLDSRYVVIGNNDLVFHLDFFDQISKAQSVLDQYPVVSPNIVMLDGTPQNPHVISGISKFREFIYDAYHSSYFMARIIIRLANLTRRFTDRKDEQQYAVAQEIYQGYGACYILTPMFFDYFDELWAPTFLMYEEFFLTKQLADKGLKIYYEPRLSVTHHCHASTGMIPGKLKWQYSREAHKTYRQYVKVWR